MDGRERKERRSYHVKEVCRLTGVTRKTLFYYDRIGLLKPSGRTGVQNHKTYDEEALECLRMILVYRDAGMRIEEIRRLLDEEADRNAVLREILQRLESEKNQKEYQIRRINELIGEIRRETEEK